MKRKLERFLAFLLSICMVLTSVSVGSLTTYADTEEEESQEEARPIAALYQDVEGTQQIDRYYAYDEGNDEVYFIYQTQEDWTNVRASVWSQSGYMSEEDGRLHPNDPEYYELEEIGSEVEGYNCARVHLGSLDGSVLVEANLIYYTLATEEDLEKAQDPDYDITIETFEDGQQYTQHEACEVYWPCQTGANQNVDGVCIADMIDWGDNGTPSVRDDANYMKGMQPNYGDEFVWYIAVSKEGERRAVASASDLRIKRFVYDEELDEEAEVELQDGDVIIANYVTESNETVEGFYNVRFNQPGTYRIGVDEDTYGQAGHAEVYVEAPMVAFTKKEPTEGSFSSGFQLVKEAGISTGKATSFYMAYHPQAGMHIDESGLPIVYCYDPEQQENVPFQDENITCENLGDVDGYHVVKVTVAAEFGRDENISFGYTVENDDGGESVCFAWMELRVHKSGLVVTRPNYVQAEDNDKCYYPVKKALDENECWKDFDANLNGEDMFFIMLEENEDGERTERYVGLDELVVLDDEGNETDAITLKNAQIPEDWEKYDDCAASDIIDISPNNMGRYRIALKENPSEYVLVTTRLPRFGVYETYADGDVQDYIPNDPSYSDKNRTFYIAVAKEEWDSDNADVSVEYDESMMSLEQLSNGPGYHAIYKCVVKKNVNQGFEIRVVYAGQDSYGNESNDERYYWVSELATGLVVNWYNDSDLENTYEGLCKFISGGYHLHDNNRFLFGWRDTPDSEVTPITGEFTITDEKGEDASDCFDVVPATKEGNEEESEEEPVREPIEGVYEVKALSIGTYYFTYNESSVKMKVVYPRVGLYTTPERSNEGLLEEHIPYKTGDVYYAIVAPEDNDTIDSVTVEENDCYTVEQMESQEGSVYKITVTTESVPDFWLHVVSTYHWPAVEEDEEPEIYNDERGYHFYQKALVGFGAYYTEFEEDRPVKPEWKMIEKDLGSAVKSEQVLYLGYIPTDDEGEPLEIENVEDYNNIQFFYNDGSGYKIAPRGSYSIRPYTLPEDMEPIDEINDFEGVYNIRFNTLGDWKLVYKKSSVIFHVGFPTIGFYESAEPTVEGLLDYNYKYDLKNRDFYLIQEAYGLDQELLDDPEREYNEGTYKLEVHSRYGKDDFFNIEDVTPAEEEFYRIYKYTVKKGVIAGTEIRVEAPYFYEDEFGGWGNTSEAYLWMEGDQSVRATEKHYVDGQPQLGYAGCFITEQEFRDSHAVEYDSLYGQTRYWIHGKTIQELIDNMNKAIQGELPLYDENGEVVYNVENTGYIHVVVSQFGGEELPEEYISASGEIKGIQFESGDNPVFVDYEVNDGERFCEYEVKRVSENAKQRWPGLEDVSYIALVEDELYTVKINEKGHYIADEKLINLSLGNTDLAEISNCIYDDDLFETEILGDQQFPDLHVNMTCDMQFSGKYGKIDLGFPEGSEAIAEFYNAKREFVCGIDQGNVETYANSSLEYTYVTSDWDDDVVDEWIDELDMNVRYKTGTVDLKAYMIKTKVESKGSFTEDGNAIEISAPTPNDLDQISDEAKDEIAEGKQLTVTINADGMDEETASQNEEVQTIMNELPESYKSEDVESQVVDLTMTASVDTVDETGKVTEEGEKQEITTLSNPVEITIAINNFNAEKAYSIATILDGKLQMISAKVDRVKRVISFFTDHFTPYIILSGDYTPAKAVEDMLNDNAITWDYAKPFIYDGEEKTVSLSELPEGFEAVVENTTATNAGSYVATVTAIKVTDAKTGETEEVVLDEKVILPKKFKKTLTWNISKATIGDRELVWACDENVIYDKAQHGEEYVLTDECLAELGLSQENVTYGGDLATDVGCYVRTALVEDTENNNYVAREAMIEWQIEKAEIDISNMAWQTEKEFTFDGKAKAVKLVNVPSDLSVSYVNAEKTEVGKYTAVAVFDYNPDNYDIVGGDLTALKRLEWEIKQAVKPNDPTPTPSSKPTPTPTSKPTPTPTTVPTEKPSTPASVGSKVEDKKTGASVKVTSADEKNPTVTYVGAVDKSKTAVVVPDTVTDENGITYKVTVIADNAFKNNKKMKSVKIGKNITKIGKNAFKGCTTLKKVSIPKTVTQIGANAFDGDKAITQVTIANGVKKIDANAFKGCTALKKVTIPASVTNIGKAAFSGCKALGSISIKTVKLTDKSVGANAFKSIAAKATVSVPSKKKAAYKVMLKKKGLNGKQQRIK